MDKLIKNMIIQIKSDPSPKSKVGSISFSIKDALTLLNKTSVS
jgi:hypothetical protein